MAHEYGPQYSTTSLSYLLSSVQPPTTQPAATSFLGREGDITFRDRVFPKKIGEYVKNIHLLSLIEDEERFTSLSDSDSIRVCLLLSLEVIFMGHELGSAVDDVFLRMVENLEVWNYFPWGEHIWGELYAAIRNVNSNHKEAHYKALEINLTLFRHIPCLDLSCVSRKALLDDFEAAETVVLKPLLPEDEGLEDEGFEYEGFEDEGLPLEMSSLAEKGKPSSLKKGKHSSLEKGKHSSLEKGKPSSLEMSSLEEISSV
ncbi:hypothetical protein Tco_0260891 [Tanacetum coccineum]